jgi:hypothetical protein
VNCGFPVITTLDEFPVITIMLNLTIIDLQVLNGHGDENIDKSPSPGIGEVSPSENSSLE